MQQEKKSNIQGNLHKANDYFSEKKKIKKENTANQKKAAYFKG